MHAAIDIDLRRFTVASSLGAWTGNSLLEASARAAEMAGPGGTVLIEVASPVSFQRVPKAHLHNVARWAVFNLMAATVIHEDLTSAGLTVLVSPSNVWTRGYTEEQRHMLSGAEAIRGKNQRETHDARECWSMLWSWHTSPSLWVPLPDYLNAL